MSRFDIVDMSDGLSRIMDMQLALQQRLGYFIDTEWEPEELAEYVRMNVLACEDELHEALGEFQWKPWARGTGFKDRDAFVRELIDALHFMLNLFLAAGVEPGELLDRYGKKHQRNLERQDEGYDGTAKCGRCGRECQQCESPSTLQPAPGGD